MQRFYKDLTKEKSPDILLGNEHETYRDKTLDGQWNKKKKERSIFSMTYSVIFHTYQH